MKIGITGSFGFLGSNLTAHLLKKETKNDIICFYSKTLENPVFDSKKVISRHIDIRNFEDVLSKTKDIDILFHIAGKVSYRKMDAEQVWKTNVLGTRNILEAALQNKFKKIIYISSINVLGANDGQNELSDETNDKYSKIAKNPNLISSPEMAFSFIDRSLKGNYDFIKKSKVPYFDSKLAGFELAKHYVLNKKLPVITVFPGTVIGPGDIHKDVSELIERIYTNRILFTFKGGTSFVDVRDCAEGIHLCMTRGSIGESYIISGRNSDNLLYKNLMIRIADVAEKQKGKPVRKRFIIVPHHVAKIVSSLLECVNPHTNLGNALVESGRMVHTFTSKKALSKLGYIPKYSLEESIRDCYNFLKFKK